MTFDDLYSSNQGHIIFKALYFIHGASYDQSVFEIHIVIYYDFSV